MERKTLDYLEHDVLQYNKFVIQFLARVHDDIFPAENMMSPSPKARDDITFSSGTISSCTLARNRMTYIETIKADTI